jgi:hypothetical protein
MAVVTVATTTVKPDRYEEYVEQVARKAKAINEKNGAKNVRLLAGLVAGQATGSLVFISENDDWAAMGATFDKNLADPELIAMLSTGEGSPVASYQVTQWVDVPL